LIKTNLTALKPGLKIPNVVKSTTELVAGLTIPEKVEANSFANQSVNFEYN